MFLGWEGLWGLMLWIWGEGIGEFAWEWDMLLGSEMVSKGQCWAMVIAVPNAALFGDNAATRCPILHKHNKQTLFTFFVLLLLQTFLG